SRDLARVLPQGDRQAAHLLQRRGRRGALLRLDRQHGQEGRCGPHRATLHTTTPRIEDVGDEQGTRPTPGARTANDGGWPRGDRHAAGPAPRGPRRYQSCARTRRDCLEPLSALSRRISTHPGGVRRGSTATTGGVPEAASQPGAEEREERT